MYFLRAVLTGKVVYVPGQMSDNDEFQEGLWLIGRLVNWSIEGKNGHIRTEGGKKEIDLSPVALARQMKKIGIMRVVYSDIAEDGRSKQLNISALRDLATMASVRVTAQGGIQGYRDLLLLQELEKFGVDSVIVGRALYENRFPCQRLWRLNEEELTDLGPTRRI